MKLDQLLVLCPFTGDDAGRYDLSRMELVVESDDEGPILRATATDGARLVTITAPAADGSPPAGHWLVKPPREAEVDVAVGAVTVMADGPLTVWEDEDADRFPDTAPYREAPDGGLRIRVSAKRLLELIQAAADWLDVTENAGETVVVALPTASDSEPIRVLADAPRATFHGALMPMSDEREGPTGGEEMSDAD